MIIHVIDADTGDGIPNWKLNLDNGELTDINALTHDFADEKRFTRYKKLAGTRYRRIKPRDRKREQGDISIDGWIKDYDSLGQLNFLGKKNDIAILLGTDQMIWYDALQGGGAGDYVDPDVKSSLYYAGVAGSETTGAVDTDITNFISGTANSTEAVPGSISHSQFSATGTYSLQYRPSLSMDWSLTNGYSYMWLHSTLASTDYVKASLFLGDDEDNGNAWDLTFSANTWTEHIQDLSDSVDDTIGTGLSNLNAVSVAGLRVETSSKTFTINLDLFGVYGEDAYGDLKSKREIPFWAIEKAQSSKNGPGNNWTYRMQLKRTKNPPW